MLVTILTAAVIGGGACVWGMIYGWKRGWTDAQAFYTHSWEED
jgi:hypothetical protein